MLRHLRALTPFIAGLIVLTIGVFFTEWLGIYDAIPHFDKVLHLLGGVVVAWFALALLQSELTRMTAWKQVLLLVSVTALVGVAWEWAEFASNATRHSFPVIYHYFHGGDLADTLGDLIADIVGAILFSLWALRKERS